VVFYNDPNSEHAGVIRLDGGVTAVPKYDPADPDKGLSGKDAPGNGGTPPDNNPPGTPPDNQPPPPPNNPAQDPANPPDQPYTVRISLSKPTAQVGADITLKVVANGDRQPTGARWTFGDGQTGTGTGTGTQVTHHWNAAQTYQVSVRATFLNGRTATASLPIQVTARRPTLTLSVPATGGTVSGAGITCPPACSVATDPGQPVTLTTRAAIGFVFAGWSGGCAGTALSCTVVMNGDKAVAATFQLGLTQPVAMGAPALVSPADGKLFLNYPRNTTLTWRAVAGAAKYSVEVQCDTCGASPWVTTISTTTTGLSYSFNWVGDNTGRWRVTAIAPDGTPGTPSGFRTFRYDTRLAGFVGNWTHANTNAVPRITVAQLSATTASLHVWGQCTPLCDWGTTTATLSGGVLNATYNPGFVIETVRVSQQGTQLVVQVHYHFIDNSGRPDMDTTDVMTKS
jgi:hypothetical protein